MFIIVEAGQWVRGSSFTLYKFEIFHYRKSKRKAPIIKESYLVQGQITTIQCENGTPVGGWLFLFLNVLGGVKAL